VKVLRLTNSNDVLASLAPSLLASEVAARVISDRCGEPVETVSRVIWPGDELPAIVERWIARYEPDIVFLRAASFWVTYESVPLRIQRRMGRVGRWLAVIGLGLGGNPRVASSPLFRAVRRASVRVIGGDPHFTPEEATRHVAETLRVILAHESVIPVVRGPGHTHNAGGDPAGLLRAHARNDAFDAQLAALCATLHVAYASARATADNPAFLQADELHDNPEGQRVFGELEGQAIAAAWLAAVRVER
jgi:hypothetical protein